MGKGVNKVTLIGHLGKDPELKYFQSGDAFCNVSMATSESWKDRDSGEKKERTEWHNLVFTGKLAEVVGDYLKKGSRIFVEGKLTTRKWEKDGVDRYTTEVRVHEMVMLDGKPDEERPAARGSSRQERPSAQTGRTQQPAPAHADDHFEDDDIPFN
jgi:single-strand DNA-binding protein